MGTYQAVIELKAEEREELTQASFRQPLAVVATEGGAWAWTASAAVRANENAILLLIYFQVRGYLTTALLSGEMNAIAQDVKAGVIAKLRILSRIDNSAKICITTHGCC